MAVVFIQDALGFGCDEAAESHRQAELAERENFNITSDHRHWPLYYETLEAGIQHIPHRHRS